jgi:hypothetical protein
MYGEVKGDRRLRRLNFRRSKKWLGILIALVVIVSPFTLTISAPVVGAAVGAENKATHRPIEDFLEAQGTHPGYGIFLTWANEDISYYASVDYAGLDYEWILTRSDGKIDIGTEMSGTITEKPLADGRTVVHVVLHTSNALTWVQSYAYPYPIVFGSIPAWITDRGAEPALADCVLDMKYITNAKPSESMSDLMQIIFEPENGQEILQARFTAMAKGHLNSGFGVEQGTAGIIQITQKAPLNAPGLWKSGTQLPVDWPVRNILVKAVGN